MLATFEDINTELDALMEVRCKQLGPDCLKYINLAVENSKNTVLFEEYMEIIKGIEVKTLVNKSRILELKKQLRDLGIK